MVWGGFMVFFRFRVFIFGFGREVRGCFFLGLGEVLRGLLGVERVLVVRMIFEYFLGGLI